MKQFQVEVTLVATLYVNDETGKLYARFADEFNDGRFEEIEH